MPVKSRHPWVLVTLRYKSYCRLCAKKMEVGEVVEYKPTMGHVHVPIDGEYKCHPLNKNNAPVEQLVV